MPRENPYPIDVPHCRARAFECVLEAQRAAEPALKNTYLDMARAWLRTAQNLENRGSLRPLRRVDLRPIDQPKPASAKQS
jgi:hypothetical protein